jgi:hypothetical protein
LKRIDPAYLLIILEEPLTITDFDPHFTIDQQAKKITINACEIAGHLVFKDDFIYPYEIRFTSCTFSGNLVIHKGTFKNISFSNVKQGFYSFAINGGTFESVSFLDHCSFQSDFKIQDGTFQELSFQGGTSMVQQVFIACCSIRSIALGDCKFENPVKLMSVTDVSFFLVRNLKMSALIFYDGEYIILDIGENSIIQKLQLAGGKYELVQIKTEEISELSVSQEARNVELAIKDMTFTQMGKINVFIQGCTIGHVKFNPSYIHKDAILRFLNVVIGSLSFSGLVNYGQLGFYNIELQKEITISNSDLGKTSFINSNLSEVKMNFEDSRITDTFFSKGSFPQRIAEDEHQQRQAFAQLKKINENKGDYLEANHFYAKEMNAYYRTITWKKNFWEKLNLCFNKYSNDHGQNWHLALGVLSSGTVILFMVYLLRLGITIGSPTEDAHLNYFAKCLSYLPEFLNPVHRTDEIAKGLNRFATSSARLIEGLSRVFIAFAIYQLIQAFRKHGKK